jgi:hypothetical protein
VAVLGVDGASFNNDVVYQGLSSRLRVEFWYPVFGNLANACHTWICAGMVWAASPFLVKHTHHGGSFDAPIKCLRQNNVG